VPIVLLVITIYPQVLSQGLIHPFRLPVRLGVVCRGPISLNIQPFEEMPGKLGDELRAPVGDSVDREAM